MHTQRDLVDPVAEALRDIYQELRVAEERARNLVFLLEYAEEEDNDGAPLWSAALKAVCLRLAPVDLGARSSAETLEAKLATVAALRAYVAASWRVAPSDLEMFAALARLGVPAELRTSRAA